MLRVCVVSDTHRHRTELLTAIHTAQPMDGLLHAGDESTDVEWLDGKVDLPVFAVAGNWDSASKQFPLERVIDQFGPRILLIHGHTVRVKDTYDVLLKRAHDYGARIVVYGHTHAAYLGVHDGVLVVNPGSLAQPRGRREKSFVVLDIEQNRAENTFVIRASLLSLQGHSLSYLELEL